MLRYKEMCDRVILENGGTLTFILECYKNQKMCNNVVDNYPQEMCDKAVDDFLPLKFVPVGLLQNKLKNLIRIHSLMMI